MKTYNEQQLNSLRASGRILVAALAAVKAAIKEGVSTLELDQIAEKFIREKGGEPAFSKVGDYGRTICASVNEESIHGLPRADKILKNGDIISIDCGVKFEGMCTDACRTFAVGEISVDAAELIEVTEQCFKVAVEGLKAGHRVGSIGEKIQNFIHKTNEKRKRQGKDGYSILETFFGHGIGEKVHEAPLIPNFDVGARFSSKARGSYVPTSPKLVDVCKTRLLENSAICIEPMINAGTKDVKTAKDGWTVVTADGKLAAHFENTLIIKKDGVEIVTE